MVSDRVDCLFFIPNNYSRAWKATRLRIDTSLTFNNGSG